MKLSPENRRLLSKVAFSLGVILAASFIVSLGYTINLTADVFGYGALMPDKG